MGTEPLIAHGKDVLRLVNASLASRGKSSNSVGLSDLGGENVWWGGDITRAPKTEPPLPSRSVSAVVLSNVPFRPPSASLNSETVGVLPWAYINWYCGTFLTCSVLMLCITCGLCAQRICQD